MEIPLHSLFRIVVLMLLAQLTNCANRTAVVFTSQPPGAVITELGTGTELGNSPTAIQRYDLEAEGTIDEEGCYVLDGVEARWASGAIEQMQELHLCGNNRLGYTVNLVRPDSFPDLEKDLVVANALQERAGNAKQRSFSNYESGTRTSLQSDIRGGAPIVWFSAPPPGYDQPQIHFRHPPRKR